MTDLHLVAKSERMPPNGGRIEGVSALAGHLSLAALLVRESVQNSWDARDDHRGATPVAFEMNGWDLDADALDHLRRLLPVDDLTGFARRSEDDESTGMLHPKAVLDHQGVQVLVLADRNTVGLCGPTRSGFRWEPVRHGRQLERGQQRFANFVRNSGRAVEDIGHGDGGAFGIGKTALWMASLCGTVLIHTRTTDEAGEPTERFIGSVQGNHFYADNVEYTGRHFIGREGDDGVIEPLVGADAAAAARGLPLPAYEYNGRPTDGTSIVIVAPRIRLDWRTEMQRIRDAVRWQVWPKMVPGVRDGSDLPDMEIKLNWNNNPVELPAPLEDPEIRPYAKTLLDCARERNSGEEDRDIQARCGRPIKLLGQVKFRNAGTPDQNAFHLTLTDSDVSPEETQDEEEALPADADPAVDFDRPWGQIALIRREPLLLVRYEPIGGPDSAGEEVGVFLSADDPEVEAALTKAEPPAHDDWIYKNVPKDHGSDHRRTFAKRTIEEIRSARRRFLNSHRRDDGASRGGGERAISKEISDRLIGGLGGGLPPTGPGNGPTKVGGGPRATLKLVRSDQDGADTVHELDVKVAGIGSTPTNVVLTASGNAQDSAGSMDPGDLVRFHWFDADGNRRADETIEATVVDDDRFSLLVTVTGDLRIRPRVKVGVADGA